MKPEEPSGLLSPYAAAGDLQVDPGPVGLQETV